MKIEFEESDIQAIANKVTELLGSMIPAKTGCTTDAVFDKQGLSEYLQVDVSWIDKQITLRTIPYFKAGKYTRFKKSNIDKWIDSRSVEPLELKKYGRR